MLQAMMGSQDHPVRVLGMVVHPQQKVPCSQLVSLQSREDASSSTLCSFDQDGQRKGTSYFVVRSWETESDGCESSHEATNSFGSLENAESNVKDNGCCAAPFLITSTNKYEVKETYHALAVQFADDSQYRHKPCSGIESSRGEGSQI